MILVDSNVWIDHLHRADERLTELLTAKQVRCHPYVLGEVALGLLGPKRTLLNLLQRVRSADVASTGEVLDFIGSEKLHGKGIGYVDAHLLASCRLMTGSRLWTRDKRLHEQAERLGVAYAA